MYQVKWFSKKKGYGFVEDSDKKQFFIHHTDIQVGDGFIYYLKEGEIVSGEEESMDDGNNPLRTDSFSYIGRTSYCEVERRTRGGRTSDDSPSTPTEEEPQQE